MLSIGRLWSGSLSKNGLLTWKVPIRTATQWALMAETKGFGSDWEKKWNWCFSVNERNCPKLRTSWYGADSSSCLVSINKRVDRDIRNNILVFIENTFVAVYKFAWLTWLWWSWQSNTHQRLLRARVNVVYMTGGLANRHDAPPPQVIYRQTTSWSPAQQQTQRFCKIGCSILCLFKTFHPLW